MGRRRNEVDKRHTIELVPFEICIMRSRVYSEVTYQRFSRGPRGKGKRSTTLKFLEKSVGKKTAYQCNRVIEVYHLDCFGVYPGGSVENICAFFQAAWPMGSPRHP